LANCLENAVKKEQEIPNIILQCINLLKGKTYPLNNVENIHKKMRSSEEILKDYGLR